jgi:hypothetical protein
MTGTVLSNVLPPDEMEKVLQDQPGLLGEGLPGGSAVSSLIGGTGGKLERD